MKRPMTRNPGPEKYKENKIKYKNPIYFPYIYVQ